jgi:hypothetical protein
LLCLGGVTVFELKTLNKRSFERHEHGWENIIMFLHLKVDKIVVFARQLTVIYCTMLQLSSHA